MKGVKWDKGLPLDVVAMVAKVGGCEEMKEMRAVSKRWQQGFELGVTAIKILNPEDPLLPSIGSEAVRRFPRLAKLDLGGSGVETSWLPALRVFPNLINLSLGRKLGRDLTPGSLAQRLVDADMGHLRGLRLAFLDLSWCGSLTDAGLEALGGVALSGLSLCGCSGLTADGLACLRGLPLTHLDIGGCSKVRGIYW